MTDLHPDQASPARAEAAFSFLATLDFRLEERWVTGGNSFRDGWRLTYSGPAVELAVQYMDMQFEVRFVRAGVAVDYLFIDRERFGQRSGLHGDMFPPQKLGPVIELVAADIHEHYSAILKGDDAEWGRIKRLIEAPRTKPRLP